VIFTGGSVGASPGRNLGKTSESIPGLGHTTVACICRIEHRSIEVKECAFSPVVVE